MYPVDGGGGVQLSADDISASWPSVSPDGRFLYFEEVLRGRRSDFVWSTVVDIEDPAKGRYQIRRLDLQTREILEITSGSQEAKDGGGGQLSSGGACAPEISPGGRWLAFIRRVADGTAVYKGHEYGPRTALWLRDLKTGGERLLLDPITPDAQGKNDIGPVPRYAWTRDGKSLVIAANGKLKRVYVENGRAEDIPFKANVIKTISEQIHFKRRLTDGSLAARFLRWPALSPDGKQLVFQATGRLWLMELPDGKPRRLTVSTYGVACLPRMSGTSFTGFLLRAASLNSFQQ
jgi:Tol biopolymer transport system component